MRRMGLPSSGRESLRTCWPLVVDVDERDGASPWKMEGIWRLGGWVWSGVVTKDAKNRNMVQIYKHSNLNIETKSLKSTVCLNI